VGIFREGTSHKLYEQEKASSNMQKGTILSRAVKRKDALFADKEYLYKNFKAKKVVSNNLPEFSFKSGSKRPRFTKTGV
jgi:hypothetical protein